MSIKVMKCSQCGKEFGIFRRAVRYFEQLGDGAAEHEEPTEFVCKECLKKNADADNIARDIVEAVRQERLRACCKPGEYQLAEERWTVPDNFYTEGKADDGTYPFLFISKESFEDCQRRGFVTSNNPTVINGLTDEIKAEVTRSSKKYRSSFVSSKEALGAIFEEFDEVKTELRALKMNDGKILNEDYAELSTRLRTELVQLAAMSIKAAYSCCDCRDLENKGKDLVEQMRGLNEKCNNSIMDDIREGEFGCMEEAAQKEIERQKVMSQAYISSLVRKENESRLLKMNPLYSCNKKED